MRAGAVRSADRHGRLSPCIRACAVGVSSGFLLLACASGPSTPALERADAAFAAGRLSRAAALYRESERGDPQTAAVALHGLARVTLAQGDPDRASSLLEQLALRDLAYYLAHARNDHAEALVGAAEDRLGRGGDVTPAIDMLETAGRLDPDRPAIARALAEAHTLQGDWLASRGQRTLALGHFAEARGLSPGSADPWVGAAEILIAVTRRQEALALLGEARHLFPADGRVRSLTIQAMHVQ